MKNAVLAFLGLACLAITPLCAVEKTAAVNDRFYGKITAVDHSQKSVTVHNKKQDQDARFQWDDKTTVISEKKSIQPAELKVGQSLMVSYITENNLNKAQRISVRRPFKKTLQ